MVDHNQLETFGARLRWAILRNFKNIQQFSIEKKYAQVDVYRWVGGKRIPKYTVVTRLASDLGVAAGWLVFGDEGVRELVREPIPQPKISLMGGGVANPLPEAERKPESGNPPGWIMSSPGERKPLAPVRALPRRVSRAS